MFYNSFVRCVIYTAIKSLCHTPEINISQLPVQFSWQSCSTLCNPTDCSMPGFPVLHYLSEFAQTHTHWVVMPSNCLIFGCPLLLSPSIFPSIRVFSNESALWIRWPKYGNFSLSISSSNEYSGLISFRMDWLISLQSKGLSRVFSNTTVQKQQFFGH